MGITSERDGVVMLSRDNLRSYLPQPMLACYRQVRMSFNRWKYRGHDYYCNVCKSNLRAWAYAGPANHCNLVCPVCNSYGRHRMMVMVIKSELLRSNVIAGNQWLHFAPELGFGNWLKRELPFIDYKSADLFSLDVDMHLDLQSIALPDESTDTVILSHVLEHVDNDNQALRELNRILRPGGMLFIQVPLSDSEETIEDKLDSAEDRLAQYGKTDHVRLYGADILYRIASSGFAVSVHAARNAPYIAQFEYMALDLPERSQMPYANESTTFVCRKPI